MAQGNLSALDSDPWTDGITNCLTSNCMQYLADCCGCCNCWVCQLTLVYHCNTDVWDLPSEGSGIMTCVCKDCATPTSIEYEFVDYSYPGPICTYYAEVNTHISCTEPAPDCTDYIYYPQMPASCNACFYHWFARWSRTHSRWEDQNGNPTDFLCFKPLIDKNRHS